MTSPAFPGMDPNAFDLANDLLAQVPAKLHATTLNLAEGPLLAITIRTTSTTMTLLLSKADANKWWNAIKSQEEKMSASGLIVA